MEWNHIQIPNGDANLFCNCYVTGKSAMNIIVTHTPICTTLDVQSAYAPLTKYGVNIFAFDFSGTGKSGGDEKKFSVHSIVSDLDKLVDYIEEHYSSNIHLFGDTGIGGMFAQCYICSTDRIKSFAQFACVDYKNTAGMGYPYFAVKMMSWLFCRLPNFHLTIKPPKYNGYNCEQDNGFYEMLIKRNPYIFKSSTKVMNAVFECLISPDSPIQNSITIPTLVFKTLHDRYFSKEYFDSYFSSLNCKKKLIEINDVHNSYYLRCDEFCEAAYNWFSENQEITVSKHRLSD